MDEFQVGDRVTPVDEERAGDYLTYGEVYTVTRVERPCVLDRVYLREVENRGTSEGWFAGSRFDLVESPRKGTPKAGDTVRVVLEGPASVVYPVEGSFRIGWNAVHVDSNHTVSIEILKPAKPSAKDLPVGSVVLGSTGQVYVKRHDPLDDRGTPWHGTGGLSYSDASLDEEGWTLLVPQESE